NLGLTETVDCAKNALDKRTGGTVNGDIISQGGQFLLKGDNRKHLGFHNQDGSVRMWLYKDKGGDGVRLNNGNDGGGDWLFHKNGNLHTPSGIFASGNITVSWGGRTATFHENGDVAGPIWGGPLSAWIKNRTQASGGRGGWWYKDESSGFVFQGGVINRTGDLTRLNFPRNYQRECFGVQMTLGLIHGGSAANIEARDLDNNGFTAYMASAETNAYWWSVGV
ncbi:MAG: hypothetical protein EKE20_17470, partial [Candidatus Symbiopectobacterium sp. Dall1.0]|nr:hypothetical protein [Candidatus Symbiopectobacterium sp. Dall1.0]